MERASFFTRTRSSSLSSSSSISDEKYVLLPLAKHQKPKIRVRTLLGHCLYRRVIIWTVAALFILGLTLSTTGVHLRHGRVLDLVDFRQGGRGSRSQDTEEGITFVVSAGGQDDSQGQDYYQDDMEGDDQGNMPDWIKFRQ